MLEESNSYYSSSESENIDLNNILTQEEHLLSLEDLLQKLPGKYHKALNKMFNEKSKYFNLYFKGFSINRLILKAINTNTNKHEDNISRLSTEDKEKVNKYENKIRKFIKDFKFNNFQFYAINRILETKNKNFLISAPTASGKTYLALFSYLKYGKMIYVVPLKALINDLCEFFEKFNLNIKINCGDEISKKWKDFDVLFVTPEKLDLLILHIPLNVSKNKDWFNKVKVMIFDEIHILNDSRGPVIELIFSKLIFLKSKLKILALSATLSNQDNLCKFLNAELIEYTDFRKHDVIVDYITNITISEYEVLFHILKNLSKNEEKILIFVDSRIETYKLLCNIYVNFKNSSLKNQLKKKSIIKFYEEYYEEIASNGFFIHHGGLKPNDKKIKKGWKLIVSTNTLAWGININPDLIIIKSEFDYLNIIQMKGRVGRIKGGRAIIFKQKFPNLIIKSRMSENFDFWLLNYINFLSVYIFQEIDETELKIAEKECDFEYKMFMFYILNYKKVLNKHIKFVYKEDLIIYLLSWYENTFSFYCESSLKLEIMSIIERYKKFFLIPFTLNNKETFLISPLLNISYDNGFSVNEVLRIYNEMNYESTVKKFINSLTHNYSLYKDFLNPRLNEYNNCDDIDPSNADLYERLKKGLINDMDLVKYISRYLEIYKEISIFKQNSDVLIEILTFIGKYLNLRKGIDSSIHKESNYSLSRRKALISSKKFITIKEIIKINENGKLIFHYKPPIYCYLIVFSSGRIEKYQILKRKDAKNNIILPDNKLYKQNILVLDESFKIIFQNF